MFFQYVSLFSESVEQNTVDNATDDEAAGQPENRVDQTLEEPEAIVEAENNSVQLNTQPLNHRTNEINVR
uniref:Uncharacterized protein n=1 Tax=Caenorhabditis japonica TaxID=281687 RepID=A0A8R1ERK4_CAEJA